MKKAVASVIDFFAILGLIVADLVAAARDFLALVDLGRPRPDIAPAPAARKAFGTRTLAH